MKKSIHVAAKSKNCRIGVIGAGGHLRQFFFSTAHSLDLHSTSPPHQTVMAISDMLNRRVRARPDDDDDVYSEESDTGQQPSQDEDEQGDSDADLSEEVSLIPLFHSDSLD